MELVMLVLMEMENVYRVKKTFMGQSVIILVLIHVPLVLMILMEMVLVLLVQRDNTVHHVLLVVVLMGIVLVKMDYV
jgi:hypothetical protein